MAENDINNEEQYKIAADKLMNYISNTDFKFSNKEEIEKIYDDFRDKYSPEKLEKIPDNELLNKMFLHNKEQDNLCYALEFENKYKIFGLINSLSGSYKYPAFWGEKEKRWITGYAKSPQMITEEEALIKAKETRKLLSDGYNIIKLQSLNSLNDYISLENKLEKEKNRIYKTYLDKKILSYDVS